MNADLLSVTRMCLLADQWDWGVIDPKIIGLCHCVQSHTAVRLTTSNIKEKCRKINRLQKEKRKKNPRESFYKDDKQDLASAGLPNKKIQTNIILVHQ